MFRDEEKGKDSLMVLYPRHFIQSYITPISLPNLSSFRASLFFSEGRDMDRIVDRKIWIAGTRIVSQCGSRRYECSWYSAIYDTVSNTFRFWQYYLTEIYRMTHDFPEPRREDVLFISLLRAQFGWCCEDWKWKKRRKYQLQLFYSRFGECVGDVSFCSCFFVWFKIGIKIWLIFRWFCEPVRVFFHLLAARGVLSTRKKEKSRYKIIRTYWSLVEPDNKRSAQLVSKKRSLREFIRRDPYW